MKNIFFTLFLFAILTLNFGCTNNSKSAEPLELPQVNGLASGAVYTTGVSISVDEKPGLTYLIQLNGSTITNNSIVTEDGEYILKITVTSADGAETKEQIITFTILKDIEIPVITGVTNRAVYTTGVCISIGEIPELKYTILLNDSPISNNTFIVNDGLYNLKVIVKNKSETRTQEKSLSFSIQKDENTAPTDILEMLNTAERLPVDKRAAYISSYFPALSTSSDFPFIKNGSATFVYQGNQNISIKGAAVIWWGYGTMPMKRIEGTDISYKTIKYDNTARLEY